MAMYYCTLYMIISLYLGKVLFCNFVIFILIENDYLKAMVKKIIEAKYICIFNCVQHVVFPLHLSPAVGQGFIYFLYP